MKTFRLRLVMSFMQFALIALSLSNCKKEELVLPSLVQFSTTLQNVTEGGEAMVTLLLDKAADRDGSVHISVAGNVTYGERYTTDPATINGSIAMNIVKGQTSIQFKVMTVDNNLFEGNKAITFILTNPSEALKLGALTSMTFMIIDDEGFSFTNFAMNAGTIRETEISGLVVQIDLSRAPKNDGSITVAINSAIAAYGKDFRTSPASSGNSITLNILPNETSVSFTVLPIHNYIVTQDLQITFSISTASGAAQKGTRLNYSLTIINEDQESLVNFAVNSGILYENNTNGIIIEIPFSAQAPGEGSILVSFAPGNASYGNDFTTIPAAAGDNTITLNVAANQASASFKVLPMNNSHCSYDRLIQLKILFTNGSVKKGSNLGYTLTMIDDEQPSIVSFAENAGTVYENNASGIVVQLKISKPAIGSGVIYISPLTLGYGSKFRTSPEATDDFSYGPYVTLNVTEGATSLSFTVLPINNANKNSNYLVDFSMWNYSSGGCLQTAPNAKYALTIVDDD